MITAFMSKKCKEIINMTPHDINIYDDEGNLIKTIPPSGNLIRLKQSTERVGELCGIPISRNVFGEAEGLPEYKAGVYYIVSAMVKSALPNRKDLLVPSESIRDEKGRIIGVKSLGI